jgi:alpha-L-fucosidase
MKRLILLSFVLSILCIPASAQEQGGKYFPETDPLVLKKLQEWQDLKFGLLMHWGPYSQWGAVESWSICSEDEGWCVRRIDDYEKYKKEYEGLKKTFNPTKFDPSKWSKAAKEAGMRYVVFTTKHHDGFCMFNTALTDYRITDKECPFSVNPKANIAKEIFDAFRKDGFWTGAYFSKPDWHSPYYWWPNFATPDRNVNYDIKKYPERWQKFIEYTHGQIDELMSNYGKMDILWLDGGWVAPMTDQEIREAVNRSDYKYQRYQSQDINMAELARKAREKQPGLIVVDRAVPGKFQNYLTPENTVPDKLLPYPWESCIIAGGGWSWVPNAKYRSARSVVHMLVDIVSKGGNLLLNIAPSPEGTWDDQAYLLLKDVGKWMHVNSEAIYNSKPVAPYKESKTCLTSGKDGSWYVIYLADETEKELPSDIWLYTIQPQSGAKITMLGTDTELKWEKVGNGFIIKIPETLQKNPPCDYAWTFKITGGK